MDVDGPDPRFTPRPWLQALHPGSCPLAALELKDWDNFSTSLAILAIREDSPTTYPARRAFCPVWPGSPTRPPMREHCSCTQVAAPLQHERACAEPPFCQFWWSYLQGKRSGRPFPGDLRIRPL